VLNLSQCYNIKVFLVLTRSVKPDTRRRNTALNPTLKGYHRLLLQKASLFPVLEGAGVWNFIRVSLSHVDVMFEAAYVSFSSSFWELNTGDSFLVFQKGKLKNILKLSGAPDWLFCFVLCFVLFSF